MPKAGTAIEVSCEYPDSGAAGAHPNGHAALIIPNAAEIDCRALAYYLVMAFP